MSSVLLIEDSPQMRLLMRTILEADGHTVLEADEGTKGLHLVVSGRPDCILLDLMLPGIDGLSILRCLNAEGFKIPVIVVTSYIQERVREQCLAMGAVACIGKPIIEDQLRYAVRKVLDDKKQGEPSG